MIRPKLLCIAVIGCLCLTGCNGHSDESVSDASAQSTSTTVSYGSEEQEGTTQTSETTTAVTTTSATAVATEASTTTRSTEEKRSTIASQDNTNDSIAQETEPEADNTDDDVIFQIPPVIPATEAIQTTEMPVTTTEPFEIDYSLRTDTNGDIVLPEIP